MKKIKEVRGMPISPFFVEDENEIGISLNGSKINIEVLLKCQKALSDFIDVLDNDLVADYNKEMEDCWKNELKESHIQEKVNIQDREGYIYLIYCNGLYKIGRALGKDRIGRYTTENPFEVDIIATKFVKNYKQKEKELLERYKKFIVKGKEWLDIPTEHLPELISLFTINNNKNE